MGAHSLLSPSAAARWMRCPASVMACADLPNTSSPFAEEGTLAHELAETCLRRGWQPSDLPEYAEAAEGEEWQRYPLDMREHVQRYVDDVRAVVHEVGGVLHVEQRLDLSFVAPDTAGTADAVVVGDGVLVVADLKFGQGVRVEALENPQLMLYALGAIEHHWADLGDAPEVTLIVHQPRLDHVSQWTVPAGALELFRADVVAAAAAALGPAPVFAPGVTQCRWCGIRGSCAARAEHALALARDEFADAATLTAEQVAAVLPALPEVRAWADALEAHALSLAGAGRLPGHKLVEGRSMRRWSAGALAAVAAMPEADQLIEPRLVAIGQAEKILGRGALAALTEKPPGAPKLVPEHDPRPALQGTQSAITDFSEN